MKLHKSANHSTFFFFYNFFQKKRKEILNKENNLVPWIGVEKKAIVIPNKYSSDMVKIKLKLIKNLKNKKQAISPPLLNKLNSNLCNSLVDPQYCLMRGLTIPQLINISRKYLFDFFIFRVISCNENSLN